MTEQAEQVQTSRQRAALEDSLRDFLSRHAGQVSAPSLTPDRDSVRRRRVSAKTGA
jgi:hypothetical protein